MNFGGTTDEGCARDDCSHCTFHLGAWTLLPLLLAFEWGAGKARVDAYMKDEKGLEAGLAN